MLRLKSKMRGKDCFFNLAPQCKSAVVDKGRFLDTEYLVSGGALTCVLVALETDHQLALSHLDSLSDFNYFVPDSIRKVRVFYNTENKDSLFLAEKFQHYLEQNGDSNSVDIIAVSRQVIGSAVYLDENFNLVMLNEKLEKAPRENMMIYSYLVSLMKPLYVFNFEYWRENLCPSLMSEDVSGENVIQMCFWMVANRLQELINYNSVKLQLEKNGKSVELILNKQIISVIQKYMDYYKQHLLGIKRYKIKCFRPKRCFKDYEIILNPVVDNQKIDLDLLDLYRYNEAFSLKNNIFRAFNDK